MTNAPWASRLSSWRKLVDPSLLHYVSLGLGGLLIAYLARTQWFFFDEWTILAPDSPGILVAHVGHLSAVPVAITWILRAAFGVDTYWPYWLVMLASHLALTHLLWRVMRRARVNPWIATSVALLLLLFGAGAENIFWAFQYGFVGAMALAVGVFLLVARQKLGVIGIVGAAVLAMAALASSGTSLPIIAAAIVLAYVRGGIRRTAAVFAVPVVVYGFWFLTADRPPGSVDSVATALQFIPQFAGTMLTSTFSSTVPLPGVGVVVLLGLLVWVVAARRSARDLSWLLPVGLFGSAVVFALLTGYSRFSSGLELAGSSRYVYFVFATSVPAIGAALTSIAGRSRAVVAVASVGLVLLTLFNLGLLTRGATQDGDREQGTRRQISAALEFAIDHPTEADPAAVIDPQWAPDLTVGDVEGMHDAGWMSVGSYTGKDLLDALAQIATRITPATAPAGCATSLGDLTVLRGQSVTFSTPSDGALSITVTGVSSTTSDPRAVQLPAGDYTFDNLTGKTVMITGLPGGSQQCDE